MYRRWMYLAVTVLILSGCQSHRMVSPEPVAEPDETILQEAIDTNSERVSEEVESVIEEAESDRYGIAQEPVTELPDSTIADPVNLEKNAGEAADEAIPQQEDKEGKTMILMKTSEGDIKIELDAEHAPKTVANFLGYVESGHYNGTIFHRVIDGFMIQGGGFDASMHQKNAPNTVENEADNGLPNDAGTIAMARTQDPHSAGAQFFINVNDNTFLNHRNKSLQGWGYCVFGKVVDGMDVVNKIKKVPTGNAGMHQDVPRQPVTIQKVSVVE